MRRLDAQRQGATIVVGKRGDLKRIEALAAKQGKTQADKLDEILLRLKRIEEHMDIR